VVVVDGPGGTLSLAALEEAGDPDFGLDVIWRAIRADDPETPIFTPGTTGPPKAALWSNRTITAQTRALDAALPMPRESIVFFLPMAHRVRINGPTSP
jgi:long-subunit acyl-CoA synthetase (AMP-forming)